jgi:hypothetical protein
VRTSVLFEADKQVQVKGSDPILQGELFNDIAKDDSSWTIGKTLSSAPFIVEILY